MNALRCSCGRTLGTAAALAQHRRAKGCSAKAQGPVTRILYCCQCEADVEARLTDGRETYPHRADLASLPFWRHDACGCFVGCHHKTKDRTRPLGCIPGPEMKRARRHIHELLDPLWRSGRFDRDGLYARLSAVLGREYHTGELRTLDEARMIYSAVRGISLGVAA